MKGIEDTCHNYVRGYVDVAELDSVRFGNRVCVITVPRRGGSVITVPRRGGNDRPT